MKILLACLMMLLCAVLLLAAQFSIPTATGIHSNASVATMSLILNNTPVSCSGAASCTQNNTPTAGDAIVVHIQYFAGSQLTLSSITCGGTACTGGNAFTIISGAGTAAGYDATDQLGDMAAYLLSAPSGITSITGNWSGNPFSEISVRTYRCAGGTITFDTSNSGVVTCTSSTCPAGPTLTLAGTNDTIFASASANNEANSVSAPYGNGTFDAGSGWAWADRLNTGSGTGATFGTGHVSDVHFLGSIALKCQ